MSGEQLTRDERREEYYRLLSIVDAQTSKAQPAMASKTSITTIASRIGLEWEKRLKAAVENEDLLAYDGRVCLADREAILDRLPHEDDPDILRALVVAEAGTANPRTELIGDINTRLQEVTDDE